MSAMLTRRAIREMPQLGRTSALHDIPNSTSEILQLSMLRPTDFEDLSDITLTEREIENLL